VPLYFPFELSERRPVRLLQGYAFKVPRAVVSLFGITQDASVDRASDDVDGAPLGIPLISTSGHHTECVEAEEGNVRMRAHFVRERDSRLVREKKRQAPAKNASLACEVCGFDFERCYGERGRGFIECHHVTPLHSLDTATKTTLEDLALVCSNCHRMIHAEKGWLTVTSLQAIVSGRK
jgi:hypothetical protein